MHESIILRAILFRHLGLATNVRGWNTLVNHMVSCFELFKVRIFCIAVLCAKTVCYRNL